MTETPTKSNLQKRIDKITAARYLAQAQNRELMQRLERFEARCDELERGLLFVVEAINAREKARCRMTKR